MPTKEILKQPQSLEEEILQDLLGLENMLLSQSFIKADATYTAWLRH